MNNTSPDEKKNNPRGRASFEPRSSAKSSAPAAKGADSFWDDSFPSKPASSASGSTTDRPSAPASGSTPGRFSSAASGSTADRSPASSDSKPAAAAATAPPAHAAESDRFTRSRSTADRPSLDARSDSSPEPNFAAKESSPASFGSSFSTGAAASRPMPVSGGIFGPLLVLFIFMVAVAIVLPRLPMFSHVIELDDRPAADFSSVVTIVDGEESADVVQLQKALYQQGFLAFDDITGIYDSATLDAVNRALAWYKTGTSETSGCSQSTYERILSIASGDVENITVPGEEEIPVTTDPIVENETTTTTEEPVTTTTTEPTEPTEPTEATPRYIRIKNETKLRQEPDSGSRSYGYAKSGTHAYIDQTEDEDGNLWYRIRYSDADLDRTGWVLAEDCEPRY